MKPGAENWMRQVNAQIAYYLKRDPHSMSDDEWAMAWNDLLWVRQAEKKAHGQT